MGIQFLAAVTVLHVTAICIVITQRVDRVIGRHGIRADPIRCTDLFEGAFPIVGAGRAGIAHANLTPGTIFWNGTGPLDETLGRVSTIPSFGALGAIRNGRVLTTTLARDALVVSTVLTILTAIRVALATAQAHVLPRLFRRAMVASRTVTVLPAHRNVFEREATPPKLQVAVGSGARTVLVELALGFWFGGA